jgi:hypothetical protein
MINSDGIPCHIPHKDEPTSVSNFLEVQTERLCHSSSSHGMYMCAYLCGVFIGVWGCHIVIFLTVFFPFSFLLISENKTFVSTECETSEASNDHDGNIQTVGKYSLKPC